MLARIAAFRRATRASPLIDRVRQGPVVQALKMALSAALAWWLGALLPGAPPQPYLAPLTAVLSVQLTVTESLTGASHRVLGVAIGVGVALLTEHFTGPSSVTIAALVLACLGISALLRLQPQATTQVLVSGLVVLMVGGSTGGGWEYGWARLGETMVGAVVGVATNALLAPPSEWSAARTAWRSLAAELIAQLRDMAMGLHRGMHATDAVAALERARATFPRVEATRAALRRAEDSLRFNYVGYGARADLVRDRRAIDTLEHSAIQVRGLARILSDVLMETEDATWIAPDGLGNLVGDLIDASADVMDAFCGEMDGTAVGKLDQALDAAQERRRAVIAEVRSSAVSRVPMGWVELGALLAYTDRLVADASPVAKDDHRGPAE